MGHGSSYRPEWYHHYVMYEVMYQPLETFNGNISTQTINVSGTEMSVFQIELQEFVNYTISVRAYTSVGAGPYSDEMIVLTLQDGKYNII